MPGRLALGTASLSFDRERSERLPRAVHAALDAGIRVFDTATAYTTADAMNHGERILGAALRRHPLGSEAFVVSKGGHWREGRDTFPVDARPITLRRHVEASLRALRRDTIDMYLVHWPDHAVPLEGSVQALEALRVAGKIKHIGVSNVSQDQLRHVFGAASLDAVQNHFSVFDPDDAGVVRTAGRLGLAYFAHSPLKRAGANPAPFALLEAAAAERGVSPQRLALAWVLGAGPQVVAVVGATRVESVIDSAAARALTLSAAERAALAAITGTT